MSCILKITPLTSWLTDPQNAAFISTIFLNLDKGTKESDNFNSLLATSKYLVIFILIEETVTLLSSCILNLIYLGFHIAIKSNTYYQARIE